MTRARRRFGALTLGAGGFVLASIVGVATVAFACTDIMGSLSLTPTSGHAGTSVSTSAAGLKPKPAKYELHFANSTSGDCMSFSGVTVLKTIRTDSVGQWTNVRVMIPSVATLGTHSFCGMELYPRMGGSGTQHMSFTVV